MSDFDLVVIGSGPGGQSAAIQGARAGKRVLLIERDRQVGGACVNHGTIPSKALRETASALIGFRRRSGEVFKLEMPEDLQLASLMTRMGQVIEGNHRMIGAQLATHGVERWYGRAEFVSPRVLEVLSPDGHKKRVEAPLIVIATGSRPRTPPEVPVDHEQILDSDSILSMTYLPRSLTVLGSGVIASEYASIFSGLGVKVLMVDKASRPLAFLDPELGERFKRALELGGARFIGEQGIARVELDPLGEVRTTLNSGEVIRSEKLLCALGRVANLEGLSIGAAGLEVNARGLLEVDDRGRTKVPHILAVGDVTGPPSLASSAMEQGRRAVCLALGAEVGASFALIPVGVYTLPEISSIGLDEAEARRRFGGVRVGRSSFDQLARGKIAAIEDGMLKMVADPEGRRLLGVQIIGEGASELIHVGQMALLAGSAVDVFVDNIFNFPTLAEAYRVAALEIVRERGKP